MSRPTYLLDTNIVSYALDGRHPFIARQIGSLAWSEYAISVVTRAGVLYGLHKAPEPHPAHLVVRRFLGEVQTLDWGREAADAFALLLLEVRKQPLPHLDVMIAAHAISLNAIWVTNNVKYFERFTPLLKIENWVGEE